METVFAFLLALVILIAVHEYGHYRMALACGVKVLRFSVGFGKPIFSWRLRGLDTEFVIGALPLGGYVRMLDEREGVVNSSERHLAFNTQPLRSRALIVAAGPLANLLLAVVLYASVNWIGVQEPVAVLATPVEGSLAEAAGVKGGELVLAVINEGGSERTVHSFEDLRWHLTRAALGKQRLSLRVSGGIADQANVVTLDFGGLDVTEVDALLFAKIGIQAPRTPPVLGRVLAGGAAERAGLQSGDRVQRVDGEPILDAQQLLQEIRISLDAMGNPVARSWLVERHGTDVELMVTPILETINGNPTARIGAIVGVPPKTLRVQHGFWGGLERAATRTWEVGWLSVSMMGRMLIGEASLKNLSGPLTIADFAGKSANVGLTAYLTFLALISVSLGVLNLLPVPVLDGGHLMYYLWEFVTGHGVSEVWAERLQRGGAAVLLALMGVALFNDAIRIAS